MIKINKLKKKNKLGSPKQLGEAKVTNLDKPVAGEQKQLCFKVPVDFHREYKRYAVDKDKQMVDILMASFSLYKAKNL